jgi:tetratricopeptide (TPR) repeat protein
MSSVDQLLETADALLEKGRVAEARLVYAEATEKYPDSADAWMMLGLIAQEQGQPDTAEAHLRRAVELDDQFVEAMLNLANVLRQQGRLDEAAHFAQLAVQCDGDYSEAWVFLGGLYQSRGMIAEAIAANEQTLRLNPALTPLWLTQAALAMQYGQFQMAAQCYRQVIAQTPNNAEAHNQLGGVLMRQAQYTEAEAAIRTALRLNPEYAEAHANLGNLFRETERFEEAAACFRQALEIKPDFVGALINLGHLAQQQKRFTEAIPYYEKALEIAPDFADAYFVLGNMHLELGDAKTAVRWLDAGLHRKPDNADARVNLGCALNTAGEWQQAVTQFMQVLAVNPSHAQAHFNLGLTQKALGRYVAAADSFQAALALDSDNIETRLALSLVSLLRGELAEGWRHYGVRPSMRDKPWGATDTLADNLRGKRFLLVKDQGIGDEIFFLRFAPLLKARGAWIACRTDPKIASLLARCPSIDQVLVDDAMPDSIDATFSVGDLPFLLGVDTLAQLPPPLPLTIRDDAMVAVRQALQEIGNGPFIGVTWWAGSKASAEQKLAYREIPLPALVEVLRGVNTPILILQRNPSSEDIAYLKQSVDVPVHDLSAWNDDIERMLALLSVLDDYVGVDNTNMHLSACVGKPCRILVPHPPEWRAMAEGRHSVWFPEFALYRQLPGGDWSAALQALKLDLTGALNG